MLSLKTFCCLLYLTAIFIVKTNAIEVPSRQAAGCAYLSKKIYCYGGYIQGSSQDDGLYMLDINKNNGTAFSNLNNQWQPVNTISNGIALGIRDFAQAVPLPDGKSLMIQGGRNYQNSSIVNQTVVYNAETNTWSTRPNYYEAANGGNRQIYYGTGVYVDSLNSIAFYGGFQQHVQNGSDFVELDGTKVSGLTFSDKGIYINSYAGFYYLALYDLSKNSWRVPEQTNVATYSNSWQSATYVPLTKKIYYIGGRYYNTTDSKFRYASMKFITIYNTMSGEWEYVSANGNDTPKERAMHSTTLMPDGHNILLYGGSSDESKTLMEYCYTFDVLTTQWTLHNLVAPVGVSAPRSYHSAVLIDNSTLGIFFGLNKDDIPTNDLLILDIRNISNLAFASTYPISPIDSTDTSTAISTEINTTSESNTGTTVGIAVGVAGGVILAIAFILLYVVRKRKQRSKAKAIQGSSTNQSSPETEMLEVDWDQVDGQYFGGIQPPQQFAQAQAQSQIRTQTPNEYDYAPVGHSEPSSTYVHSAEGSGGQNVSSEMTSTYTKPDIGTS